MSQGRTTFFQQSGWMLLATVAAGGGMALVQWYAGKTLSGAELGVYGALLGALGQIGIPVLGLQSVFAHQAASAVTPQRERELAGTLRGVALGIFIIWLVIAAVALVTQPWILKSFKIGSPLVLWITLFIALAGMWQPMMTGVLQGAQRFYPLGGSSIVNGLGRFAGMFLLVQIFGVSVSGVMGGVLIGTLLGLVLVAWTTREAWRGPRAPVPWGAWFRRVVPITLGLAAPTCMFTMDTLAVQYVFPKETTGDYNAARVVGVTLLYLTAAMTQVMFPKIVRSAARLEKSDALMLALGASAVMGVLGCLACTLLPALPLRILWGEKYIHMAWLVPWFAWCILPVSLAGVLVNNLLARERYAVVPWLLVVGVGYAVALRFFHGDFVTVVRTMGIFGLVLLALTLGFTRWAKGPPVKAG